MNTNANENDVESEFKERLFDIRKDYCAMKNVNFHFHTQPLKLNAFIHDSRKKEKVQLKVKSKQKCNEIEKSVPTFATIMTIKPFSTIL